MSISKSDISSIRANTLHFKMPVENGLSTAINKNISCIFKHMMLLDKLFETALVIYYQEPKKLQKPRRVD